MRLGLTAWHIDILIQELFGVAYSFCSGTKAVLKPTSRSSSNEYGFQSIGMGPVYLGHEHGLVNGSSSACGNGCGGGCAGGCGNGRGESLCFGEFVCFHLGDSTLTTIPKGGGARLR